MELAGAGGQSSDAVALWSDAAKDRGVVATGGIDRWLARESSATIAGGGEVSPRSPGKRVVPGFRVPGRDSTGRPWGTGDMHGKKCGYNENSWGYNFRDQELKKEIPA